MNSRLRKKIFVECFKGGQFGTITFTKKSTGEERILNCKIKPVKKEERKKTKRKVNKDIITIWDIPNEAYKSIDLKTIKSISAGKEVISFG